MRIWLVLLALLTGTLGEDVEGPLSSGDLVVGSRSNPPLVAAFDPDTGEKVWHHECTACDELDDVAVTADRTVLVGGLLPGGAAGIVAIGTTTVGEERIVTSAGALASVGGIATTPDGQVMVTSRACRGCAGDAVVRVDLATGAQVVVSSGGLLVDPRGLETGPDGTIFVAVGAEHGEPAVVAVDPLDGSQRLVAGGRAGARTLLSGPVDVAVDTDGVVFVLDVRHRGADVQDEVRIFRIGNDGPVLLTTGVEGIDPRLESEPFVGLAISGTSLLAVDYALASDKGGVNLFDPLTGALPDVTAESALTSPSGLAIVAPSIGRVPGVEDAADPVSPVWVGAIVVMALLAALAIWRRSGRDAGGPPGPNRRHGPGSSGHPADHSKRRHEEEAVTGVSIETLMDRRHVLAAPALAQDWPGLPVACVEGTRVFDRSGRSYLDFLAGFGACNVGHNHPPVVD